MRYFNALAIRILLLIISEVLLKYNITYTDIDYFVFTDGAKHLINFESPYKRETYRYTPLLALMMLPNINININFGKVIFVFLDILNGICIEILLNLQNLNRRKNIDKRQNIQNSDQNFQNQYLNSNSLNPNSNNLNNSENLNNIYQNENLTEKINNILGIIKKIIDNPFAYSSLFYLYNPFVINISTRGSADCLIIFFILITLIFLELDIYSLAGICYGLSIHFKIYPIIYGPAILLYIITKNKDLYDGCQIDYKNENAQNNEINEIENSISDNYQSKLINFLKSLLSVNFYMNKAYKILKFINTFYMKLFRQIKILLKYMFKYLLNLNVFVFFTFAIIIFGSLFAIFYLAFGNQFAYEYLLYHVVRKDHRHNYSIFSYLMYLTYTKNFGKILSLLAFLPQAILIILVSIFLFSDLNICLVLITWIFVTFNKVVTAQYYLWYLSLLPMIIPYNKMFLLHKTKTLILFSLWLYFEVFWNNISHRLEFKGESLFIEMCIWNMVFFLINCVIIEEIASDNISKKEIK